MGFRSNGSRVPFNSVLEQKTVWTWPYVVNLLRPICKGGGKRKKKEKKTELFPLLLTHRVDFKVDHYNNHQNAFINRTQYRYYTRSTLPAQQQLRHRGWTANAISKGRLNPTDLAEDGPAASRQRVYHYICVKKYSVLYKPFRRRFRFHSQQRS